MLSCGQATNLWQPAGVIHPEGIPRKGKDIHSLSITTRSSLATMAVMAGLLTVAGPATAASTDPSNPRTTIDATMLLHGDFSTFVTNEDSPVRGNLLVFSGDAYDNEMGVRNSSPQLRP